jgi:biopolymer transport protein TolR
LASEINVTPFVDVMLVLLIVFMVTAPLLTAGVEVELPKTAAQPLEVDEEPLILSVTQNGTIHIGSASDAPATPLAELSTRLAAIAEAGTDARIFIRADGGVDWGVVAQVLTTVRGAGFRNIGFVTDASGRQPGPAVDDQPN